MIKDLKRHYQHLFDKFGDSVESVQHINRQSQYKRFEILLAIDKNAKSIIDVGCGLGDMYQYLLDNQYSGQYLGLDFLDEFTLLSRQKYADYSQASFQCIDVGSANVPCGYDYALLSGVFNNKMENNKQFMFETISKMFASANKGIAFNAMSTYVDYQDKALYYSDPLEVFDFCKKNLSRKVTLKHDYTVKSGSIPFEYTIYLYKEDM
ncbi:class I SAM-dependent methyltransferase [Colwelliaceae bacterium 6441]